MVLERLTPAERLAFVLHDMFGTPFEEIAPIVGRSPEAARQLASRARRRVQGPPEIPEADLSGQRRLVDALLAAVSTGDLDGLLALLDPEFVVRTDAAAVSAGAAPEVRGAEAWAKQAIRFGRGVRFAQMALVNGAAGVVVAPRGRLSRALTFTIRDGKIVQMDVITNPVRLRELDLAVLGD